MLTPTGLRSLMSVLLSNYSFEYLTRGLPKIADGNEPEIGEVFKTIDVPREDYFVTTKL